MIAVFPDEYASERILKIMRNTWWCTFWTHGAVAARGYLPPGANVCVAAPHPVAYLEI